MSGAVVKLGAALAVLGLATSLAACSGSSSGSGEPAGGGTAVEAEGGWEFTDDQGITHVLDEVPDTIAAQSVAAGGLWELGVVADGVFGPLRRPDGSPDPAIGLADPDDFTSLGEIDSEINLEALAALHPDIIVTAMWGEDRYWGIDDDEADTLREIAPIVGIRVDDRTIDEPLARFAELAGSLGADLESGQAAEARAEFERASADLAEALAANPDLEVAAVSGTLTEMYVAYPPAFPDLRYFQELGMNLVEPTEHPTSGGFWQTLSWEEAGTYPVDLILADARVGTPEQALELLPIPLESVPALAAGQIAEWRAAHAYGYGNLASILDDLTEAVRSADPDVGEG